MARLWKWIVKRFGQAFSAIDDLEFLLFGAAAAVLLVAGPWFIFVRWVTAGHYAPAIFLGLLWCGVVAACFRDLRRRRFSWVSGGITALWLLTMFLMALVAG